MVSFERSAKHCLEGVINNDDDDEYQEIPYHWSSFLSVFLQSFEIPLRAVITDEGR